MSETDCGTSRLNALYADLAVLEDLDFSWLGWWDDDGRPFFARSEVTPGCWGDGETPEEAVAELKEAIHGWLDVKWEHGHDNIATVRGLDYSKARTEGWIISEPTLTFSR